MSAVLLLVSPFCKLNIGTYYRILLELLNGKGNTIQYLFERQWLKLESPKVKSTHREFCELLALWLGGSKFVFPSEDMLLFHVLFRNPPNLSDVCFAYLLFVVCRDHDGRVQGEAISLSEISELRPADFL